MTAAVAILSIAPVTILGNILAISAFYKDPNKELRSAPSNILLMSLALSDLFVGAIQSPLADFTGSPVSSQGRFHFHSQSCCL